MFEGGVMKLKKDLPNVLLSGCLLFNSGVNYALPTKSKLRKTTPLFISQLFFSSNTKASNIQLRGNQFKLSTLDKRIPSHLSQRRLQIDPGSVVQDIGLGSSTVVNKAITTTAIPQNLEFCLLSDATGSFSDDQANLRDSAGDIATAITNESPGAKFGYAAFKDTGDSFVYSLRQTLTTNAGDWLASINALSPSGGGDFSEAQWDGIACATDIDYCPTGSKYSDADCGFTTGTPSKKVLVVTTDATFSSDSDIQNDLGSTTNALLGANVILIGLKAPGSGNELDQLATATGGSVLPLSSDGSNVGNAILSGLGNLPTTVTHSVINCPDGLQISFDTDSQTVTSGTTAYFQETIQVTDPDLAGQTVHCSVDFLANGALIGTQALTITVPLELTVTPENAINPLCTDHDLTASVLSGSAPVSGAEVTFSISSGPNAGASDVKVSDDSGIVTFTYAPSGTGIGALGTDNIQVCTRGVCKSVVKNWDLVLDASPDQAVNELGSDQTHTVTVLLKSNEIGLGNTDVHYEIISGPNAGQSSTEQTNGSGESKFSYNTEASCSKLGTDHIKACSCDICEIVEKTWEDTTPPVATCLPGLNPAGNEPDADNQDGFFTVSGSDDLAEITQVELIDSGSGVSFGFYDVGAKIKYVQAPGAPVKVKEASGEVDWKLTGNGDLKVIAVDCAGNESEAHCLVPPPPARFLK